MLAPKRKIGVPALVALGRGPLCDKHCRGTVTKGSNPRDRVKTFCITTDITDRDGDLVVPSGGEFDDYKANPVFLWAHQFFQAPIGKCVKIWLAPDGHSVLADIEFAPATVNKFADDVWKLYEGNFLNAVSIGFRIVEAVPPGQHFSGRPDLTGKTKRIITRWSLLEISAVPIPANPEALAKAFQDGLIVSKQLKDLIMPEENTVSVFTGWLSKMLGWSKDRVESLTLTEAKGLVDVVSKEMPTETAEGQEVCPKCGKAEGKCECKEEGKAATSQDDGEKCESCGKVGKACTCQKDDKGIVIATSGGPTPGTDHKPAGDKRRDDSVEHFEPTEGKPVKDKDKSKDLAYWETKAEFSAKDREKLAKEGVALPDGSFPIRNKKDLENAIHDVGRAKDKAKAKAHIKARARAIGAEDILPDDWKKSAEPEVQKNMNSVARLAYLIETIAYLQRSTAIEAENEGDKSPIPGRLKTALKDLGDILRDMTVEEVDELIAGTDTNSEEGIYLRSVLDNYTKKGDGMGATAGSERPEGDASTEPESKTEKCETCGMSKDKCKCQSAKGNDDAGEKGKHTQDDESEDHPNVSRCPKCGKTEAKCSCKEAKSAPKESAKAYRTLGDIATEVEAKVAAHAPTIVKSVVDAVSGHVQAELDRLRGKV
jgi:hypothetical protein